VPVSLQYPVIVKPSLEHCSMGLSYDSIAQDEDELKVIIKRQLEKFHESVLVEEFIVGRELLVYLIEINDKVKVLPITEVFFETDNPLAFQTYECKWIEGHADYKSTTTDDAALSDTEFKLIEDVCVNVFKQMGLRGYARFDLRLRDGIPYILETNANPSVYDATDEIGDIDDEVISGIKFPDYLQNIVNTAIYHYGKGWSV
jgi:D-alanine-D-alanine ligase